MEQVKREWMESWLRFVQSELEPATMGRWVEYDLQRYLAILDATQGIHSPTEALEVLATHDLLPRAWADNAERVFEAGPDPLAFTVDDVDGVPEVRIVADLDQRVVFRVEGTICTARAAREVFGVAPYVGGYTTEDGSRVDCAEWSVPKEQAAAQWEALQGSTRLAVRDGSLWPARERRAFDTLETVQQAHMLALWAPQIVTAESLYRELCELVPSLPGFPIWSMDPSPTTTWDVEPEALSDPMEEAPYGESPLRGMLTRYSSLERDPDRNGRVYPPAVMARAIEEAASRFGLYREGGPNYLPPMGDFQPFTDPVVPAPAPPPPATLPGLRGQSYLEAGFVFAPYVPLTTTVLELGPDQVLRGVTELGRDTPRADLTNINDILSRMARGSRRRQCIEKLRARAESDPVYERMLRILTSLRREGIRLHALGAILSINPEGHPRS